jgi:hypothetical protein
MFDVKELFLSLIKMLKARAKLIANYLWQGLSFDAFNISNSNTVNSKIL